MKKKISLIILTTLVVMILGSISPRFSSATETKTVLDISYGPIYFYSDAISGYNSSGTHVNTKNSNGYIIIGTSNYDSSQAVQINIPSGTHNITLRDVTLYTGYRVESSAMYVASGATAHITLEGENRLYGRGVGMLVPDGANITITGGATDSLTVSALTGAGIGGRKGEVSTYAFKDCGNVTISGGVVKATGGDLSAGIGGGEYGYANRTIHIAGGTVTAATTGQGVGIGGGYANTSVVDRIQITGGSINSTFGKRPVNASSQPVYKTTLTLPTAEVAAVESLTIDQGGVSVPYNITAMNTDINGKLYIYLPANASQTTATIRVGENTYQYNGIISTSDTNTLKMDQAQLSILNVNSAYTFGDIVSPLASGGTLSGAVAYKYSGTDAVTGSIITNSPTAPTNAGSYTVTATLAGNACYYDAVTSEDFTINRKSITGFSVNDIANHIYTGTAIVPIVTVKDPTRNITISAGTDYTVSCPNVNSGEAIATITGRANYTGTLTKSFLILPKDITVSLTAFPSTTTKVGENVSLQATISGAVNLPSGTITFSHGSTMIDSDVAITETEGVYSAITSWESIPFGSYNLNATYNETVSDNYNIISNGFIGYYNVTKYNQNDFSIVDGSSYDIIDDTISKTYGDMPFTLEVSGKLSMGSLGYTSSDESVASITSSGTVTLHKSGTATLTAVSSADERYNLATSSLTINVRRTNLSSFEIIDSMDYVIEEGIINKIYGNAPFTLAVNTSIGPIEYASSDTSIATVSNDGTVTILKSGTISLSAVSLMTDCYNASATTVTLNVAKADQNNFIIADAEEYTITEGIIDKTYGNDSFELRVADNLSTSAVMFIVDSGSDVVSVDAASGEVTLHKSGTAAVHVVSPADEHYNSARAEVTIRVQKAVPPRVIFPSANSITYGQKLSASNLFMGSGDGAFAWENPDTIPIGGSGSHYVVFTPYDTDNFNYTNIPLRKMVLITVNKAAQASLAISGIPDNLTYGDAPFRLVVDGGSGSGVFRYMLISGDAVSVDKNGVVTLRRSGKSIISIIKAEDECYLATSAIAEIYVSQAPAQPSVTDPEPTQTATTDTVPTQPSTTDPEPTQTAKTDTVPVQPSVTDPEPTQPSATDPEPTQPSATDPEPTQTSEIDAVPSQDDSSVPVIIKPRSIITDEKTDTIIVDIPLGILPEGTTAVKLLSGEIIPLGAAQDSLELHISRKDIDEDGNFVLIMLNNENTPLGSYSVDLSDHVWQDGTLSGKKDFTSMFFWIIAGVLIVGGIITVMVISSGKKK